jgi:hypothetical protein
MPKSTGIAPIDLLTRTTVPRHHLAEAHVFGCPTFVLDPALQGGSMLPKFKPRSKRGVFLGLSPKHSSTVPLVLNLDTANIGAQFHVVFDDWFTSVTSENPEEFDNGIWENLFMSSRYKYHFDDDDLVTYDHDQKQHMERILNKHGFRQQHVSMHQRENGPVQQNQENEVVENVENAQADPVAQEVNRGREVENQDEIPVPDAQEIQADPQANPLDETVRRSNRSRRPPNRFG